MAPEVVRLGGAELWSETSGTGDPAVVLCHGGPGLSDNLAPVAAMIDDLGVVHRYDQRAGGRSTGAGPFTVERFVEDLDGLRAHWGHQSWIVGGHSWGGWLALLYAMRIPDRVKAIAAIGMPPPPSQSWRDAYIRARDARLTEQERAFFREIRRRRSEGVAIDPGEEQRFVHLLWRTDFADPAAVPDLDREPLYGHPANTDVNRTLVAEMDELDATGDLMIELRRIHVPALFIHGSGDPRPAPTTVAAAMPRGRLAMVENAGHLPWFERPDDVARQLRGLMEDAAIA